MMASLVNYITESFSELKHNVSWTPKNEAQRLTVIVVVFSVLFSLAIWGIDSLFSNVIEQYFNIVKS